MTQLYNLQQNLSLQTEPDIEAKELIMRLAPLYQQDRAQAVQEGEANLLIYLLHNRLGQLSSEIEGKIRILPIEKVESLGVALFDFQSNEDLQNWLNENA